MQIVLVNIVQGREHTNDWLRSEVGVSECGRETDRETGKERKRAGTLKETDVSTLCVRRECHNFLISTKWSVV